MWVGVIRGFAGIKFSGSVSRLGVKNAIARRANRRVVIPTKSLVV